MAFPSRLPMELARRFSFYSFGDHDNREILANFFALRDVAANVLDGKKNFRNQNDVCATGNTCFKRDPAAISAHDFNHHHAMVGGRGGMDFIDGVGYGM